MNTSNTPEEVKYTYFRIDFKDWPEDYDYTICEDLSAVSKHFRFAEVHLDDPYRKTEVKVTGIGLTRREFNQWKRDGTLPERFNPAPPAGESKSAEEIKIKIWAIIGLTEGACKLKEAGHDHQHLDSDIARHMREILESFASQSQPAPVEPVNKNWKEAFKRENYLLYQTTGRFNDYTDKVIDWIEQNVTPNK
jgi:hypothetical protein